MRSGVSHKKTAPGNEHNRGPDPANQYRGEIIDGGRKLNYSPSHPIALCNPQIHRVFTLVPFISPVDAWPRRLGYLPVCLYLSRMSFLTFVTPLTLRATSAALYILAWVLTKPLN